MSKKKEQANNKQPRDFRRAADVNALIKALTCLAQEYFVGADFTDSSVPYLDVMALHRNITVEEVEDYLKGGGISGVKVKKHPTLIHTHNAVMVTADPAFNKEA